MRKSKQPRNQHNPGKKRAASAVQPSSKRATIAGDPDDDHFQWATRGMDFGGPWGWHLAHPCTVYRHIIPELHGFEGMTWQQIQSGTGKGSGHFTEIKKLHRDAQKRLEELGIDPEQPLFELKLDHKMQRVWGLRERKLHILWWDPLHEVYNTTGADKKDHRKRSPRRTERDAQHPTEACPFGPGECAHTSFCDVCVTKCS